MPKRKRESHGANIIDVGLGATLRQLQGERASPGITQPVADDNDGWTVVGAPKKKKTSDQGPKLSGNRPNSIDGLRNSHESGSSSTAIDEQERTEPNKLARFENPFASKETYDERASPSNPFSTNQSRRSEPFPHSPTHSQPTHDETCDKDDGGKGGLSRAERRKERKLERHYPVIEHSHNARLHSQVKISDLQALVLYLLADGTAPQWVSVRSHMSIKRVVVLMVPGLELGMFNGDLSLESAPGSKSNHGTDNSTSTNTEKPKRLHISPDNFYPASLKPHRLPAALQPLSDIFDHVWPIKAQGERRGKQYIRMNSPIQTMLSSQIPKTREEKDKKKKHNHKGPLPQASSHWENKRTPITQYLTSLSEQQENEYVIHPAWFATPESRDSAQQYRKAAKQTIDDGWVDTHVACIEDGDVPEADIQQGSVTAGRRVLAVDCEMCKAEDGQLVLTRVSLLDWDDTVVLDKLVKPDVTIKDYLTQYSGITPAMLQDVTTTLSDIQKELLEIITPRTILVGHSLDSDLNALKLTHPFLIDTGILFPHARGPPYKQSLKWLAQKFLQSEIQKGANGHDSVEDARTCLNLVKQKCDRGPKWGTSETNTESIFKRLGRAYRPKSSGETRAGAVVDWGDPARGHGGHAHVVIGCKSDSDVVAGIADAVEGLAVGKSGTTEPVDLVWGRLRELEVARAWWDKSKTADVESLRQDALERLGLPIDGDAEDAEVEVTGEKLSNAVSKTVDDIVRIYESLPRCTAFVVYSGLGDPREMRRLQAMQQQHRREYATKNWDNLSVKWTDTEVQALSRACQDASEGIGLMVVK